MDVIVCHPSGASAAGRRDGVLDGDAVEAPIVILTESGGTAAGASTGTRGCRPQDSDASGPAAATSRSRGNGADPVGPA